MKEHGEEISTQVVNDRLVIIELHALARSCKCFLLKLRLTG
jgi:hypothetical protein